MFDARKNMIGFDDIDFELAEFSQRFCQEPRPAVRLRRDPSADDQFLLQYVPPTIDIETGSRCCADGKRTWTPEEFLSRIDWAEHFFDLWPDHLTSTLESR